MGRVTLVTGKSREQRQVSAFAGFCGTAGNCHPLFLAGHFVDLLSLPWDLSAHPESLLSELWPRGRAFSAVCRRVTHQ